MPFHLARHTQRRRRPWTPWVAVIICCLSTIALPTDVLAQAWNIVQPLPVGISGHVAAAGTDSNGKELLFVFGGGTETTYYNRNDVYDPSTNMWDSTSYMPLPTARSYPTETVVQNKIWVIGGLSGNGFAHDTVEVYDPILNSWTTKPPLQTARQKAAAATGPNNEIFVFGGSGHSGVPNFASVEMYDPMTGAWTFRTPMPEPLYSIGAELACNGLIYILGHEAAYKFPVNYAYDPVNDSWSGPLALPPMTNDDVPLGGRGLTKRPDCRLQLTNDGNFNQPNGDPRVYSYNPALDRWRIEPGTDAGNDDLASATVGDKVYAVGGRIRIGPVKFDQVEALGPIAANSPCDPECVLPPFGMTAWYPFDDANGDVADEVVAGNNGILLGPFDYVSGKVGGALQLLEGGDVIVPHDSAFDFSTGDFSVDFWVLNPESGHVVGKYDGSSQRGWEIFLNLHPFPDFNVGMVLNGAIHDLAQCVVPDNNQWNHVALVVDRTAAEIQCYVNGLLWQAIPTSNTGSVNTSAPLRMGTGVANTASFTGTLDELEIFGRALDPLEIQSIVGSEHAGKCKDGVIVPWDRPFCLNDQRITVGVDVCNGTNTTKTFELSFQSLPAGITGPGGNCHVDGPTMFEDLLNSGTIIPPPITVTVTGPGCLTIPIGIYRPVDLTTLKDVGCYKAILTDTSTGDMHMSIGSVQERSDMCPGPLPVTTQPLTPLTPVDPIISIHYTQAEPVTIEYRLDPMSVHPSEDRPVLQLNGQEPGVSVVGTIQLQPNTLNDLPPVTVQYAMRDLVPQTLILSTRAPDEEEFFPLTSISFRNPLSGDETLPIILGDTIWHDRNQNGLQDGGESGIPGLPIWLYDFGLGTIDTTVSGSSGNYYFLVSPGGPYEVEVQSWALPSGFRPTYDFDGGLDNRASISLAPGQSHLRLDFGYFRKLFCDGFESGDASAWTNYVP